MNVQTNDQLAMIYLGSLVRSVIALHNLINNKMSLREAERKEGDKSASKEKKEGEKEKKDSKDSDKDKKAGGADEKEGDGKSKTAESAKKAS